MAENIYKSAEVMIESKIRNPHYYPEYHGPCIRTLKLQLDQVESFIELIRNYGWIDNADYQKYKLVSVSFEVLTVTINLEPDGALRWQE